MSLQGLNDWTQWYLKECCTIRIQLNMGTPFIEGWNFVQVLGEGAYGE